MPGGVRLAIRVLWFLTRRAVTLVSLMAGFALLSLPRDLVSEKAWAKLVAAQTRVSKTIDFNLVPMETYATVSDGALRESQLIVSFSMKIDYPARIMVGDSARVRATVSFLSAKLTSVTSKDWGFFVTRHDDGQPVTTEAPEPEARDAGRTALRQLSFRLQMAGAKVAPERDTQQIDDALIWQVSPRKPGRLTGVMTPEVKPVPFMRFFNGSLALQLRSGDEEFAINEFSVWEALAIAASDSPFATKKVASFVPKLVGLMLIVPGIIAFRREYRARLNVV